MHAYIGFDVRVFHALGTAEELEQKIKAILERELAFDPSHPLGPEVEVECVESTPYELDSPAP